MKIGNISNIKEFGSAENFKYIVATLPVEQSGDKVGNLTQDRNPNFKEETIFLKVLVEGSASLYYTIKDNDNRFFYKMNDGNIEQLIYKWYLTKNKRIAENNRYKQQLVTDLDIKADAAMAFGAGFKFKNKYSIEARYHTARNITNYQNITSSYQSFSLIAGYNFL